MKIEPEHWQGFLGEREALADDLAVLLTTTASDSPRFNPTTLELTSVKLSAIQSKRLQGLGIFVGPPDL